MESGTNGVSWPGKSDSVYTRASRFCKHLVNLLGASARRGITHRCWQSTCQACALRELLSAVIFDGVQQIVSYCVETRMPKKKYCTALLQVGAIGDVLYDQI